jgi:outer membrane protein OmpA-like peptidoglycan-associated protein
MKKAIGLFYVFILLQFSSSAQVIGMDSLFFEKLTSELLVTNDEIILDIDIEKELQNEIPKLKSILHFILENENYLVELSSHTSCVGNLVVNLKTSETRAEKLKNELFNLVDSNDFLLVEKNLTVIGHGEFYPLIKCECAHCAE